MKRIAPLVLILFISGSFRSSAASVVLHARDAVAWLPQQTVYGSVVGFETKTIVVHHDKKIFAVAVTDNHFQFSFILHNGINRVWAESRNGNEKPVSDTVRFTLGYHPEPLIMPSVVVNRQTVSLHATVMLNPWQKLNFRWTADKRNPAPVVLHHANDSTADVELPETEGIYYFNLLVVSGKDTATYQTFVTKKEHSVRAFDMTKMHAPWIDSAIIYEISPHAFVTNPTYEDITAKLPEIKSLGVNTIWLQPLMQNLDSAQGYEVTDYFSLRDDLGSEAQLQQLIATAKQLNLHVLFDFVPNHTSLHHPYAQEVKAFGKSSHYYNFYQHTNDGAMYSSHYHTDSSGFVYYFWDDLVNLNYANKEVQQWIIEACKYWVKKYDIDGYRFDAVWGVNARQPDFGKRLQTELKCIKPDLFFLAEDKAFGGALQKGFDAVYDWTADTGWVSQWSWQYEYHPNKTLTVFNHPNPRKRDSLVHKVMFANNASDSLRLRFLENNDMPRFLATHNLEQTKTAALLMFTLPGIPLIYNGQEVGIKTFPRKKKPTFMANQTIQSLDSSGLFPFYQKLIAVKRSHPCLTDGNMEEVKVASSASLMAFKRENAQETVITIVNLDSAAATGLLNTKAITAGSASSFAVMDAMTGEMVQSATKEASQVTIPVRGFEARVLLFIKEK